jgi:hypothetical protein
VSAFRNVITDSPQWRQEYQLLSGVALRAFESAGVKGEQAMNALGILRALVRGFVLHEMAASFLDTSCTRLRWMSLFAAWTRFGPPRNRPSRSARNRAFARFET